MPSKLDTFNKNQTKEDLADIRPGDTVKVHQKIKEAKKERIQVFEGLVIARKHGKGVSATITVRKVISRIGVEKIIPIHSPNIEKIELVKRGKVRRAKLYYIRKARGRKARLKKKEFIQATEERIEALPVSTVKEEVKAEEAAGNKEITRKKEIVKTKE